MKTQKNQTPAPSTLQSGFAAFVAVCPLSSRMPTWAGAFLFHGGTTMKTKSAVAMSEEIQIHRDLNHAELRNRQMAVEGFRRLTSRNHLGLDREDSKSEVI